MSRKIGSIPLERVLDIQKEILNSISDFCCENGIRYALAYGTLLGAVRHKGYIPWDDDIDILMPRPDYDRFIATYTSAENEVIDLAKSPVCVEMFAKVSRKGTYMEDSLGRVLWGINVDVFPIDGFPADGDSKVVSEIMDLYRQIPIVCPFYRTVGRRKFVWLIKYVFKRITHFQTPDVLTLKNKIVELLHTVTFENSQKAGAYFGDAGLDEFMDKGIFTSYSEISFEGHGYPAPKDYDIYLRNLFGDYMQLPPVEQRVFRHKYRYYSL